MRPVTQEQGLKGSTDYTDQMLNESGRATKTIEHCFIHCLVSNYTILTGRTEHTGITLPLSSS